MTRRRVLPAAGDFPATSSPADSATGRAVTASAPGYLPKAELGKVGVVLSPGSGTAFLDTAVELEELGYQTIWLTGGSLKSLSQITDVVRATKRARVATGIISVDRFTAAEVSALYTSLQETYPGRFVVGLGGAHGPDPLATLNAFLDHLDQVPPSARIMAALGPKMLDLARDRATGAFPFLVTPDYTATARSRIGGSTTLAVGCCPSLTQLNPGFSARGASWQKGSFPPNQRYRADPVALPRTPMLLAPDQPYSTA